MVYNSNLPAIISRDNSNFEGVFIQAKLPLGPHAPKPGPTLLIAVTEEKSAVVRSILQISGRNNATEKSVAKKMMEKPIQLRHASSPSFL